MVNTHGQVHTEVHMSDGNIIRIGNTAAELQAHLARTHGKVVTRFPPEPNGYLHIGHAKAMFVDFGLARHAGGVCYLRFDDTNPEAEEQEYIDHIQEIVSWLGWEPWKVCVCVVGGLCVVGAVSPPGMGSEENERNRKSLYEKGGKEKRGRRKRGGGNENIQACYCMCIPQITYSSDYFQQLYDFAVQLIRDGKAFVCHQTSEEIAASREAKTPSPWRDRPVDESLKLFEDMRRGLVDEGKATLRYLSGVCFCVQRVSACVVQRCTNTAQKYFHALPERKTLKKERPCNKNNPQNPYNKNKNTRKTTPTTPHTRLKMDYKNDNYNMFDLIAYRIKFTPHPHVGDTWCVYPSYDFTHCLVDALEDVTHSLCTLEFETRRASYYWLLAVRIGVVYGVVCCVECVWFCVLYVVCCVCRVMCVYVGCRVVWCVRVYGSRSFRLWARTSPWSGNIRAST